MNVLSLTSKFLIERNRFPTFLTTQIYQSNLPDFVLHRLRKSPKKGFKNPLNFNLKLKRNRSRRKISAVLWWWSTSGPVFPSKFPSKCWVKRCNWYLSQWEAKLLITFVIARVRRFRRFHHGSSWAVWFLDSPFSQLLPTRLYGNWKFDYKTQRFLE